MLSHPDSQKSVLSGRAARVSAPKCSSAPLEFWRRPPRVFKSAVCRRATCQERSTRGLSIKRRSRICVWRVRPLKYLSIKRKPPPSHSFITFSQHHSRLCPLRQCGLATSRTRLNSVKKEEGEGGTSSGGT